MAFFQVPWANEHGALQTFGCEAAIVAGLFLLLIPLLQWKGRFFRVSPGQSYSYTRLFTQLVHVIRNVTRCIDHIPCRRRQLTIHVTLTLYAVLLGNISCWITGRSTRLTVPLPGTCSPSLYPSGSRVLASVGQFLGLKFCPSQTDHICCPSSFKDTIPSSVTTSPLLAQQSRPSVSQKGYFASDVPGLQRRPHAPLFDAFGV